MSLEEQATSPKPVTSIFSFLGLPAELRLNIYRYLAPNKPVESWMVYDPKSLRDDGGKCYPAILRTCKTIYNEALGEWYGGVEYQMLVCFAFIGLLPGTDIRTTAIHAGLVSPHPGLREIKTLRLHIVLPTQLAMKVSEGESSLDCALVTEVLPTLVEWFSHTESKLRSLHIKVELPPRLLHALRLQPNEIMKVYEWLLRPLQSMRGLQAVSLDIVFWDFRQGVPYSSAAIDLRVKEFRRVAEEYLESLAVEICKTR